MTLRLDPGAAETIAGGHDEAAIGREFDAMSRLGG